MLTLALETATRLGSVALAEGDLLLGEASFSSRAAHSASTLPEVDRLLSRAGRAPRELERVVVGSGPGSFTGVRIAASLARGLCAATGARLLAFSSLAAVAAGSGRPRRVCALFDARRGAVYAAAYREPGVPKPALGPVVLPLASVLARLGEEEGWSFAGDGALRFGDAIREAGGEVLAWPWAWPRASALLWLAERHPGAGRVADPASWEPSYLRRPGAERAAAAGAGVGGEGAS